MNLVDLLSVAWKTWPSEKHHVVFMGNESCSRAQWQEAVNARNSLKTDWGGEVLPPVGSKVEIQRGSFSVRSDSEVFIGKTVTVLAVSRMSTGTDVITVDGGPELGCEVFRASMARPVKTPEQIAVDEREKEIEAMFSVFEQSACKQDYDWRAGVSAVCDHFHRKQEPK